MFLSYISYIQSSWLFQEKYYGKEKHENQNKNKNKEKIIAEKL